MKDRILHYDPFKAGQTINAVCVTLVHKMCVRANLAFDDEEEQFVDNIDGLVDEDVPPSKECFARRPGKESKFN